MVDGEMSTQHNHGCSASDEEICCSCSTKASMKNYVSQKHLNCHQSFGRLQSVFHSDIDSLKLHGKLLKTWSRSVDDDLILASGISEMANGNYSACNMKSKS